MQGATLKKSVLVVKRGRCVRPEKDDRYSPRKVCAASTLVALCAGT